MSCEYIHTVQTTAAMFNRKKKFDKSLAVFQ